MGGCPLAEGALLVSSNEKLQLPKMIPFFRRVAHRISFSQTVSILALDAARAEMSSPDSLPNATHVYSFPELGNAPCSAVAARCAADGKTVHAVLCFHVEPSSRILLASLEA